MPLTVIFMESRHEVHLVCLQGCFWNFERQLCSKLMYRVPVSATWTEIMFYSSLKHSLVKVIRLPCELIWKGRSCFLENGSRIIKIAFDQRDGWVRCEGFEILWIG
jgi:hypothetical protein